MDNTNNINAHDEIDLREIFEVLFVGKWIVLSVTSIFSIIGVIYSLSLPNIYESNALLISSSPSNKSAISQNYSSLASIAGIDINTGSSEGNAVQAFQKLNSLSFFEANILPNIFLPDLMALKSWNPENNTLEYDNEIYDATNDKWVRNFSYPQKLVPSAQESFNEIMKHINIFKDEKTNFLNLKVKHQSPYVAQEWAELYIDQINLFYRKKDKNEAERALSYLNNVMNKTNLSEIKQSITMLLQQETQKLALIAANEFYVYEFIDPPAIMEKKSEPSRSSICILFALLGGILGIIGILLRHYFSIKK